MSSLNQKITRKTVRQALKNWHSAGALGSSPLTDLTIVAEEYESNGQLDPMAGRGLALRRTLSRALETLCPDDTSPDWNEKRWRSYLILKHQYLENKSPTVLADRLNIARSTYNHAQADALDRLANTLKEWEETHLAAKNNRATGQKTAAIFTAPPLPPQTIVGRGKIVEALKSKLLRGEGQALLGLPGVGKTTLAILLAHDSELLTHFPDGILWARLGKEGNEDDLLRAWANMLGLPSKTTAKFQNTTDLTDAVHQAIGLRRMLLIIDDAWSDASALAFRIGGPHCVHLLTTRLPEVATHFAGPNVFIVPELSEREGLSLLSQYVPQMSDEETGEARQLVVKTGGLPLTLVLIGSQLQIKYQRNDKRSVIALLKSIHDIGKQLSITQPQSVLGRHPSLPLDTPLSLNTILTISEESLSKNARRAFHTLSIFPPKPNTFSVRAAIAVCDVTADELDELRQFGLLEKEEDDRLTMHQTVSDYASTKLRSPDAKQHLVVYFSELLEEYGGNFTELEVESSNIWKALQIAQDDHLLLVSRKSNGEILN